MPTAEGFETLDEAITRVSASLANVREALERIATNGSAYSLGGESMTQGSFEHLQRRERTLDAELLGYQSKKAGRPFAPAMAIARTITY